MSLEPTHGDRTKAALRQSILTARRRRSPEVRRAAARSLTGHLTRELAAGSAGDLATFLPLDTEPPLLPALEEVHRRGRRVWVPVVEADRALRWCRWRPGVSLEPGPLPGLLEPIGPRHDIEIFHGVALLVVPAVAMAADGVRLGFGGGYYDRFLERLTAAGPLPRLLACVFHDEILPAGTVPYESHDAVIPRALTERGVVTLRNAAQHHPEPSEAE